MDNPKARSDRRSKRSDSKIPGKGLSSDQGEFLVTQDDPKGGEAIEDSSIVVDKIDRHLGNASSHGGKISHTSPVEEPPRDTSGAGRPVDVPVCSGESTTSSHGD